MVQKYFFYYFTINSTELQCKDKIFYTKFIGLRERRQSKPAKITIKTAIIDFFLLYY